MQHLFLLIPILLTTINVAFAHSGGWDKQGGHTNRKTGEYHCHTESCFKIHNQVEEATQEALDQKRPVSFIYRRTDWRYWIDADRDCLDTRQEVLQAQSVGKVKLSLDGCSVSSGVWDDPYSGNTYSNASDLDIDHVIPLKWAHEHGGANWSAQKKQIFANDPRNLLAVDNGLNRSKGAKGPDQWMPPNHVYRCDYLAHWQRVLVAYPSLQMTPKENRVFERQVSACQAR